MRNLSLCVQGLLQGRFPVNSQGVSDPINGGDITRASFPPGIDAVICVVCPEEIRIERVMKRDNVNRSEVLSRIDQQMDVEKQKALSSYIIVNDGKHMVVPQVLDIIKEMG